MTVDGMLPTAVPAQTLLERRLRGYELALDSARHDSVQAAQTLSRLTARIAELELELSAAREAPARLEARLAEQQRAWRRAEQRAYAERAYREELQDELAALERGREQAEDAHAALSAAAERRRELEDEIVRLRRRCDEAEHAAAVSRSAHERAEIARLARLVEREQTARLAAEARADALAVRVREGLAGAAAATEALQRLRVAPALSGNGLGGAEPVEPERLAAALTRLRETADAVLDEGDSPAVAAPLMRPGLARRLAARRLRRVRRWVNRAQSG